MSAMPTPMPVTRPALVTVATEVLEELHVAWLVTACEVPFERFAVALNGAVAPTVGAAPPTITEDTVGAGPGAGGVGDAGGVGVLSLQAMTASRNTDASRQAFMALPAQPARPAQSACR